MPHLSDVFHELADRDERSFANAPRDSGAIAHARRARHRTRAAQATGGTFAVGALAVGGIQLMPNGSQTLDAAASPSSVSSASAALSAEQPTEDVAFDTERFKKVANETFELIDGQFQCGGAAPTPTSGVAEISIDSVDIRSEDFVRDFQPYIDGTKTGPVPVVDDAGNTQYGLIADTTIAGTGGDALYADVPSSVVLLAKDGKIVSMMGSQQVDPTEQVEMIPAPEDETGPGVQDQPVLEFGADPVLNGEPTSVTTGYGGWGCPDGFGDSFGTHTQTYPPLGDYLEPGDYEAYVVTRVLVDDQTAAEHYLRDQDFDLWNFWTHEEQAEDLGFATSDGPLHEEDGLSFLQIEVPVPADRLPSEATDEVIVSEPVTVTVD